MGFSIKNSITYKFSTLIVVAVTGLIIVSIISIFTLGLVNKLSKFGSRERDVTVLMYSASIDFLNYTTSGDNNLFDSFLKKTKEVIYQADGVTRIYNHIKNGKTPSDIKEMMVKIKGEAFAESRMGGVKLVATFHSSDKMKAVIDSSIRYTSFVNRYISLAKQYKNNTDSAKRKQILSEISGLNTNIDKEGKIYLKRLEDLSEMISSILKSVLFSFAVFVLISIIITAYFILKSITKPLIKTVRYSRGMAKGDFTRTLDIKNKDELGHLATAFNSMVTGLKGMLKDVTEGTKTVTSSSHDLLEISELMKNATKLTSDKSGKVASAAKEMSANINSTAKAMESTSSNIGLVASAAEEMTATINEIGQSSEKARLITNNAVKQAKDTSNHVYELGEAASEIGVVTQTINDISEQTNLLALNATIEAARAGDFGKGFAVVAGEIKNLAQQTAEATLEIKDKISGMQNSTNSTIEDIEKMTEVIDQINEIVSSIASAVEEQSITTQEIAANISKAAKGVDEVSESVAASSSFATDITTDIEDVNSATNDITSNSDLVNKNSMELSLLSSQLKEMIDRFRI